MAESRLKSGDPLPGGDGRAWELRQIAAMARQAMVEEAELSPKPGLVDGRGPGSHDDLSLALLRRSALAIEPFFLRMAKVSRVFAPGQELREMLGVLGREAEAAMMDATGGSNAHRGAIWVLGLLVSAAAMPSATEGVRAIAATAGRIAKIEDRAALPQDTHGEQACRRYGVAGARGEARAGFPHIVDVGLPALLRERERGVSESAARLHALLAIMASLDDTCLLHRGGLEALRATKVGAGEVLQAGGVTTKLGMSRLRELDESMLRHHLSPGGSADILAGTLFLGAIGRGHSVDAPGQAVEGEHLWRQ